MLVLRHDHALETLVALSVTTLVAWYVGSRPRE
jgi:hypothetical protein